MSKIVFFLAHYSEKVDRRVAHERWDAGAQTHPLLKCHSDGPHDEQCVSDDGWSAMVQLYKTGSVLSAKNYLWMNKLQVREQNQAIKRILCQTSHFNNFSTTPTFVYSANFGDANIVWDGRLFNAGVIYFRFTFSESEFRFPASLDTPAVLTTTEGSEIRPTPHWSKTQARPDSETE